MKDPIEDKIKKIFGNVDQKQIDKIRTDVYSLARILIRSSINESGSVHQSKFTGTSPRLQS